ncbi:MAG: 50S ribosomal protein L6 [bacterium]|nr:50S ribosomal protein L6 [bacterium]
MSRIGNRILAIPENVTVEVVENLVKVKGPKGELETSKCKNVNVEVKDGSVYVTRANEEIKTKQMHGTVNANIKNMLEGVVNGYKKSLEIVGVGYRFTLRGNTLVINAGYSHPVELEIPEGLKVDAKSNTEIDVLGIDKIKVGEFAANIRKVREPEPYKGKGIKYADEHIRRKEGKKAQ